MSEMLLQPEKQASEVKLFLFACAYWTVSADETLNSGEQDWLSKEFGEEASQWLSEFVELGSEGFFDALDAAVAAMSDAQKGEIYPQLEDWLLQCADSDGIKDSEELRVIGRIKDRISLESEIKRLTGTGGVERIERVNVSKVSRGSVRKIAGHNGEVTCVSISDDGRTIVSGSEDRTVRLWDLETGEGLGIFRGHEGGVREVLFVPDGGTVISGDRRGVIKSWDVAANTKRWECRLQKQGGITSLDVNADGKYLLVSSDVGLMSLKEVATGNEIRTFGKRRSGAVHRARFSTNNASVVSGGDDRLIRIWDPANGSEVRSLRGHTDGVTAVCFSGDGEWILSGSRDNSVRLWSVGTGEQVGSFEGHSFSVADVCFSPDGRYVVSASWDHTMKLWDVETGRELMNMESEQGRFTSVAFHPDGRSIIGGSSENAIHIVLLSA